MVQNPLELDYLIRKNKHDGKNRENQTSQIVHFTLRRFHGQISYSTSYVYESGDYRCFTHIKQISYTARYYILLLNHG